MRVLAIDPGYDRIGFAILQKEGGGKEQLIFSECFETNRGDTFSNRLLAIGNELEHIILTHRPTACAIEKLYLTNNQKTAMGVAEARGTCTYIVAKHALPFFEYTPLQIKNAVTGDGTSDKKRIALMVQKLIRIDKKINHDDEYDAIAVGLTCIASEPLT